MSKENYEIAKKIYQLSKEYIKYDKDVAEYIKYAESQEEKEFYALISDLLLQTKQKELIDKGIY